MITIQLIDKHEVVRAGVRRLLEGEKGMQVVAEGIEQQDQLDLLRGEGCDEGQGFFIAMPLPKAEFLQIFESRIAASSPLGQVDRVG